MKKFEKVLIEVPIYNCNIMYIVAKNFLKAGRAIGEELSLDSNENCGLAFKIGEGCTDYCILVKPKYKNTWSTLAHEALHITNFILEDRGVKGSYKNDEAQAYLLSYIVDAIQTFNETLIE